MKEIIVRFGLDDTAQISWYDEEHWPIKRKTCVHAGKAMVWMIKTGHVWTWEKDLETGEEWAWCEIGNEL